MARNNGKEIKEKIINVFLDKLSGSFMDGNTLWMPIKDKGDIIWLKLSITTAIKPPRDELISKASIEFSEELIKYFETMINFKDDNDPATMEDDDNEI